MEFCLKTLKSHIRMEKYTLGVFICSKSMERDISTFQMGTNMLGTSAMANFTAKALCTINKEMLNITANGFKEAC